jgi:hypothetical protein
MRPLVYSISEGFANFFDDEGDCDLRIAVWIGGAEKAAVFKAGGRIAVLMPVRPDSVKIEETTDGKMGKTL